MVGLTRLGRADRSVLLVILARLGWVGPAGPPHRQDCPDWAGWPAILLAVTGGSGHLHLPGARHPGLWPQTSLPGFPRTSGK